VMRRAPKPHVECGATLVCGHRHGWTSCARTLAFAIAAALVVITVISNPLSAAQGSRPSSFEKKPGGILGPKPNIDRAAPLYMQADQLLYDTKNNRVIAQGNVEIYYNNYILTADQVVYDQNLNKLIAEGNAQLKDPNGSITRADRFEALDDFRDAFIQSLSVVTYDDTRIAAARATRREGNTTEYERGKFTPCKNDPGVPPLWCIGANRIIHDQRAATITYQDAQFELFGIPVLYMPYFQHPDPSVKRRTGFLTPNYAQSSTLGFSVEVPYYVALAPNYDFTFHPQYFTKYGTLWQGDWRHRLSNGQYMVKFAAIDESENRRVNDQDWAGSLETKGQFSISSWWRWGWDITVESDESFRRFYKLDPILQTDRINTVYLQGMSERNYLSARLYQFGGLLLTDSPAISNSYVYPVIDYNYIVGAPVLGGELSFSGHIRNMARNDGGTETTHGVTEINWRKKMIDPVGQVWTPFAYARGDVISYANARDPDTLALIPDDTVARGIGAVGLLYSYPFVAHTALGSNVIEPTAQIIARPNRVDQRRLPDEDAKSLVLDDTLLFDVDKFSGYDRFETGTRANLGLQYTFQTNSGFYARTVFGQSIHLSGENPYVDPGLDPSGLATCNVVTLVNCPTNFSPVSGLQTNRSDYVAGLYVTPFAGLNLIAQGRFDEKDWSLQRQDTLLNASYGPISGSVGYTYTAYDPLLGVTNVAQQDLTSSLSLRLTNNWSISGAMRYDIDARFRIQDSLTLRYADECFVLTATYIETFVENTLLDLRPDRTLMLRFELKHLGEFNTKTDTLNHVFGDTNQGPKL
jgi:LPS-assembly protein